MLTPTELLLNVLAGLGLFFVGIKMVGRNLNALASDQFRRRIRRASDNRWISALFGAVTGFVTQSGRTTAFIMASFVQGGMIDVRRAISIVLWANLGCTLIISAAVFPIHLFALFLLGAAGGCIAFERPKPLLNAAHAIFGLALMLFGLRMMSASASVLTELQWFSTAMEFVSTSLVYAFLMGMVLTFIAQSHMAIILITVTLAANGLFNFNQTLMLIYGAHAGSSLITYLTGLHFRGQPRQVVVGQIFYNLIGIALFMALFLADYLMTGHDQVMQRLTAAISPSAGIQAALVAVIFNTVTPLLLSALLGPFQRLCARFSPELEEEELSKPKFLHDELTGNPVATLLLAEKEQLRLLERLPAYCEHARTEARLKPGMALAVQHTAFREVSTRIQRFEAALMAQSLTPEDTEWLLNQQKRQELLNAIEETCLDLCTSVSSGDDPQVRQLCTTIVEALDTVLLTAISGMQNNDLVELEMLETMTRDRGTAMENIRKKYLKSSEQLSPAARGQVLHITSLFERATWSLRRFGALLGTSPALGA
jgi:phosphate:Na+ symporter